MKIENLPDFAKPYKTKGYDVRFQDGAYYLFKITSKRVEGKSYPVLQQEFIGIIDPDGTLRDKKKLISPDVEYEEFGLSDFILKKHYRSICRSIYGYNKEFGYPLIKLAIVKYVLGDISNTILASCHLSSQIVNELSEIRDKIDLNKIDKVVTTISKLQTTLFSEDKIVFESIMKLCVIVKGNNAVPKYPKAAQDLLQKHGVKL